MKLLFILVFMSLSAYGFNKDLTLVNDRAPSEFKYLFEAMKLSLRDPVEQARFIAYCKRINQGLASLKKEQAYLLIKSEMYKQISEWRFPSTPYRAKSASLKRVELNLANKNNLYTPFSRWLIEAVLADVAKYNEKGLIDLLPQDVGKLPADERAIYIKMSRVLAFNGPWIQKADTLSATQFNELSIEIAWQIIDSLRLRAKIFQSLASKSGDAVNEQTFNIPGDLERPATNVTPAQTAMPDLATQGDRAKSQAEKSLEKVDVKPSDIPASDLSNAIDKIDTSTDGSGAPSPLE